MKLKMWQSKLSIIGLLVCTSSVYASNEHSMDHHKHMMQQQSSESPQSSLSEAGNDIFGTIQEVIVKLNADPNTDWSEVDIEALRDHLLDMREMTINVEVVSHNRLDNGSEILIKPTTRESQQAMQRVLSAHPSQLKKETGWQMDVEERGNQFLLTTTTDNAAEVDKIVALGYIGLMAYGNHHQPHHWAMAVGHNPHAHSHSH